MTFRYGGHRIPFPASIPPSRVPPADIQQFLAEMRPFINAVIALANLGDGRDLQSQRLCFESHIQSESPKARRPIWQGYDPNRTRSSYQVWFSFKLTNWLGDQNEAFFMGTSRTIPYPERPIIETDPSPLWDSEDDHDRRDLGSVSM
jgi:hypothetical protein